VKEEENEGWGLGVKVRRRRRWKEETRKGAPFLVLEGRGAEMKWNFFWKEKQGLEEGDQAKPPFAPSLFSSFLFFLKIFFLHITRFLRL
jgi:hypothetical protein